MKSHILSAVCLALCCLSPGSAPAAEAPLFTLVNPLMGTDSTGGFSHGNEYPAIAVPFPMNTWAPYTQPQRDSFFYQYRQNKIRGIRQTHQPSPWITSRFCWAVISMSSAGGFNSGGARLPTVVTQ